jgi:hypothetical protein
VKLLEGHDAAVAKFVADFAPIERPKWADDIRAFGVIDDSGQLVAGVVFSDWRRDFHTVELSAVSLSDTPSAPGSSPLLAITHSESWTASEFGHAPRSITGPHGPP